ncbi:MAG TPA: DUF5063 domain-containing protein [Nocardioidaceae bacterium]|nr:DUF5063 domain-containing protein [Nocardioidaceae bacterium]
MSETPEAIESELEDFSQQIADQVESFLLALRAIARGEEPGSSVPLLLLEISQVLLAGGRLGVHADFQPSEEYEPDPGPDPDLDELRLRLAVLLESVDAYTEVFDPYVDPPELVSSLLSDDLTSIASALAHGLRHFRNGRVDEALWWWQFSYVSSWGAEASSVLRALQSIVAHDRLDSEFASEADQVVAAEEMLDSADSSV